MVIKHDMKWKGHDVSVELNTTHGIQTNKKFTNLFARREFLMTPGDGIPDDDSLSQILLEMWMYTQEEINTSEEQTKSSQMTRIK